VTEESRRLYTLAEANASLSQLALKIERLRWLRDEARRTQELLAILWQRLEGGDPVLSTIGDRQREFDGLVEEFSRVGEEIDTLGIIVRDLDLGLVDFPARLRGQPIFLCWKCDEREVGFWHGTAEGYAGRKSVSMIREW
jgi:hypothetical protein